MASLTSSVWARATAIGLLLGLATALAMAGGAAASGSKSSLPALLKGMKPMQVRIVRSAASGCEPDCAEWISAEGDIVDSTPALFLRALGSLGGRKLPVFINSGGGSIEAAMAIGRMLRARQLDVSVTRTDFIVCASASKDCAVGAKGAAIKAVRGLPNSFNSYCASACTLVLSAGTQRLASPWSHVGVHQIIVFKTQYRVRRTYRVTTLPRPGGGTTTQRTLIRQQTLGANTTEIAVNDHSYQPMESYLRQMGIADSLVPLMEATPNTGIHWMTKEEQDSTRIVTRQESGEVLFKPVDAVPPTKSVGGLLPRTSHHAEAVVPVMYNGSPVSLQFEAVYDKVRSEIDLSVGLRKGSEPLQSKDLFVTFGLDADHKVFGFNSEKFRPFGALTVTLPPTSICPLRASGTLQLSLHPVPQDNSPMVGPETAPASMPVGSAPGLTEMLAEACGAHTAEGN